MTFENEDVKHDFFVLVSAGEQLALHKADLDLAKFSMSLHVIDVCTVKGKLEVIVRVSF